MPVPVTDELEKLADWGRGGLPPRDREGGDGGRRDDGRHLPPRAYRTAIWMAMGAMLMFFVGLGSAYIVRRASEDWVGTALPRILTVNTIILLASSITILRAVWLLRRRQAAAVARWLALTFTLGVLFVAGQYIAWRQLLAAGVYIASNPSSSFFYVLTAAHAVHLLGGLGALAYVLARSLRGTLSFERPIALEVSATYWHFLDGAWIYLYLLLLVWR